MATTEVEINVGDRFIMRAEFRDQWDLPADREVDIVVTSIMGDYVEFKGVGSDDISDFAPTTWFLRNYTKIEVK